MSALHHLTRRAALTGIATLPAAAALGNDASLQLPALPLPDDEMSWEQFATLDFEPWGKDLLAALPDMERWRNQLVTIRLAAHLLTRTKPELIEAMRKMDQQMTTEGGETLAEHLMEGLNGTRDLLEGLLAVTDQAFARLRCAGFNVGGSA